MMNSMLGKVSNSPKKKITKKFFYSWEMIIVYLLIIINVLMMCIVPQTYFATGTIPTIIRSGMDLSFMVLGMVFILILGEIDVSVASIMIFSVMVTVSLYNVGCPGAIALICGILAGGALGALNGFLVAFFKLPSVIVTIATSLLYRGLVQIILGANYLELPAGSGLQNFFSTIAWYDIGGVIPVSLLVFLGFAIVFGVVLHKSKFGRELYIIGNSREVAYYSGIKVAKVKIISFAILGMMAALSGFIFIGRLNGITFSMGKGYELKVIAIAVLGGVSTLGGKGKIYGPVISVFLMTFLAKMLDLFSVHPNVQKIITGLILIIAVCVPLINKENLKKAKIKFIEWKNDFLRKNNSTELVTNTTYTISNDEIKFEENKVKEKKVEDKKPEEKKVVVLVKKVENKKPIKKIVNKKNNKKPSVKVNKNFVTKKKIKKTKKAGGKK